MPVATCCEGHVPTPREESTFWKKPDQAGTLGRQSQLPQKPLNTRKDSAGGSWLPVLLPTQPGGRAQLSRGGPSPWLAQQGAPRTQEWARRAALPSASARNQQERAALETPPKPELEPGWRSRGAPAEPRETGRSQSPPHGGEGDRRP